MLFSRFLLFFIFAALFTQLAISQRVGGGLIDTLQEQKKIKVNYPITRGETSVPTSHSLRVFAPLRYWNYFFCCIWNYFNEQEINCPTSKTR